MLQPGDDIKPNLSNETALNLLESLYELKGGNLKQFKAFDDLNFYYSEPKINGNPNIRQIYKDGYVLKIMNSLDSQNVALTEGQIALMLFLRTKDISAPFPVKNVLGEYYSVENVKEKKHIVRLLEFQPGKVLSSVDGSFDLYYKVGAYNARLITTLKEFHHPVYDSHKSIWCLDQSPKVLEFLDAVQNPNRRKIVEDVIENFRQNVVGKFETFEKGMIHGDFNENNLLVRKDETGNWNVSTVLDLGDSNVSPYLFELAITMCYMMFECTRNKLDPIEGSGWVLAGFKSVRPISKMEESLLKVCISARLCQSLVISLHTSKLHPDNDYILLSQKHGWSILELFWNTPSEKIEQTWTETFNSFLNN